MSDSYVHILVPSFHPPKSSTLFKASLAQRTSHFLHNYENKNTIGPETRHKRHIYKTQPDDISQMKDGSTTSTKVESTSRLDLFGGSMSYTLHESKEGKQPTKKSFPGDITRSFGHLKENNVVKRKSMVPSESHMSQAVKRPRKNVSALAQSSTSKSGLPSGQQSKCTTIENSGDFHSIEGIELFCRNVGASAAALGAFESLCKSSDAFSLALIFLDGTTTHVETSVKYCVPSKTCNHWHCICDRHIRAKQGRSPLLGAAICIEGKDEHMYFLCLTDRLDGQINCSTSLEQRWDLLCDIVCTSGHGGTNVPHKVMFNAQIGLMPLLRKLRSSNQQFVDMMNSNRNNMFDIKIASHLSNTDLSDEELEFRSISDRCQAHSTTQQFVGSRMGKMTKVMHHLHGELQCLLQIRQTLLASLTKKDLLHCFHQIEMPIAKQLAAMELGGIQVASSSKIEAMRHQLQNIVSDLEGKASHILSSYVYQKPFNMSSPEQVANILFAVLKLGQSRSTSSTSSSNDPTIVSPQVKTKTKGGKHQSTSEEDLQHIMHQHPIVEVILAHRHAFKVLHTFLEGFQLFIDKSDVPPQINSPNAERRVYASWNQTSTRTGRFSCQKPNLQAFPNPKRHHSLLVDGVDTNVRALFTATTGRVLISADYSQIEMRILAHMCRDQAMINLFDCSGGDIYETLARIILNKNEEDNVSKVERERAKVICLGTMYGMGLPAAASKLHISLQVAQSIVNSFYMKFKNVKKWTQFIKNDAREKGFVATITGRKRFLPDITSSDIKKRSQAERQAVNSVIQGSASDVIKYAMLSVERALDKHLVFGCHPRKGNSTSTKAPLNPARPTLISQIHDEVIYDVPLQPTRLGDSCFINDCHVQQFVSLLRDCLENETKRGLGIKVPLLIKVAIGEDWGHMTAYSYLDGERAASTSGLPAPPSADTTTYHSDGHVTTVNLPISTPDIPYYLE